MFVPLFLCLSVSVMCRRADLGSPEGIAIDHMSRNMYWTDSILDRIEVSRLDGSHRRVLFDNDLINPRPIIADPAHGYVWRHGPMRRACWYMLTSSLSLSHPADTCTGPTGTETGRRSSAPAWTGPTGRCWCRTAWGCPTDWPMTPRAGSCAGPTQVRRYSPAYYCLMKDLLHLLKWFI